MKTKKKRATGRNILERYDILKLTETKTWNLYDHVE
jgi:hypothetical protein